MADAIVKAMLGVLVLLAFAGATRADDLFILAIAGYAVAKMSQVISL